ncbi:His Kinase A (phospho-acceptor) domain-containing protein [Marinitoga hydrogenitolerans DSM 16785]|uniref:histidine kinase n=1 Tax=Marinitoga hydrogenitolerans (strain DSM 16785 / JCM 12826 / AT1271) TaxID=1122195 RepID=A0A1M4UJA9_MARH1|nr:HAMP domain-containing sensor histidine kinase [Marinitoga hydrogenitolerans]SHE56826.1 His Kinase A (phospho-acceptor) domain-containing protein [Marinitoga hydrogenitolerans DSM 16785]
MYIDIDYILIPIAVINENGEIIKSNLSFKNFFDNKNFFELLNKNFINIIKNILKERGLFFSIERKNKKILKSNYFFTINIHPINDLFIVELTPKNKEIIAESSFNKKISMLYSLINFTIKIPNLYYSLKSLNKKEVIENFINLLIEYNLISNYSEEKKYKHYFEIFDTKFYYDITEDIPINIKNFIIKIIDIHSQALEIMFKNIYSQKKSFDYLSIANNLIVGMFHEINNPLSIILMETEMLSAKIDEKYQKDLKIISDNLYRIIEITKLFKSLVKGDEIQIKLNLIDILKDVVKFMRYKANQKIQINLYVDSWKPHYIIGNRQELMIVFSNLIENAIEAIQETEKNGIINISLNEFPTFYNLIIEDNGIGISEENINRIFEPFFTTKSKRGMGYGLFFVYNICMKHNIEINVDSTLGKGTTFILKIPKIKEE